MKNQYFGDVNDYLKYGILRCFAGAELSIGICWMLTPDDSRSDGRKTTYLSDPGRWRPHDPALFDSLMRVVRSDNRHVRHAKNFACLPGANFFTPMVPDDRRLREEWLIKALDKLKNVDLLFFDPDNGLEVRSKSKGRRDSNKYLYWDEIQLAWSQGSSLVIFQHFPRSNHRKFASSLMSQLRERVHDGEVVSLVTSNVVYLLACKPRHHLRFQKGLDDVIRKWDGRIWLKS